MKSVLQRRFLRSTLIAALIAASASAGVAAPEQPLLPGLVAAWDFDEGTGTTAADTSPSHSAATFHGSPAWAAGRFGSALRFDGGAWLEVAAHERLALSTGLTVQAWIRPTASSSRAYQNIVEVWDHYLLRLDNPAEGGRLSFFTFLDGTPEPRIQAGVPAPDAWHQVIAVWDGDQIALWLDGVKRSSQRKGRPPTVSRPLAIGRDFVGAIDSIRIYGRALSEEEIRTQIPPAVKLTLITSRPVFEVGKPFTLTCEIANTGGQSLSGLRLEAAFPEGLRMVEAAASPALLPPVSWNVPQIRSWLVRADASLAGTWKVVLGTPNGEELRESSPVVVADPIPFPAGHPTRPTVEGERNGSPMVLGNDKVRLVFPRQAFGFGPWAVDLWQSNRWRRMAVANCLSYLAVKTPRGISGQFVTARDFRVHAFAPADSLAGVDFNCQFKDGADTQWRGRFAFLVGRDDRVNVTYELVPAKGGELVVLQGPTLYAGEGTFETRKSDALFCGLEWLVGDEASSSNLDAHDPEHYLRWVPHPNKITIPLMGVTHDRAAIALYWDCMRTWDGTNTRPAAVFASPNALDHQANHLMGLFLPSVPDWVAPNHRSASTKPYPFQAGGPLSLRAFIAAVTPAEQAVECLAKWFESYGVPEPAPLPRGEWSKEVDFSMRAFLESLWVPDEQKWWTSKGAGPGLSDKALPSHFAYQLRLGALLTTNRALRDACLERATLAERLAGAAPAWDDACFTWSDPVAGIRQLAHRAASLLDAMKEDGSWRFRARIQTDGIFKGMDYGLLGPDNAAEVGTCARNLYEVLRVCSLTGDAVTYGTLQRALAFVDQFRVPRAAQVWECPVHAPDILAAADALEACLEAYRFSGQRQHLEAAKRWAWRGLPFLYMWNPRDKPVLRYASIAILGGSWYGGSWIGQPVQWNGLRYAYALLKLAEYDPSFPWKRIAEGITVSALLQQDVSGPNVALWPDNFSATDWSKCPWVFEPGLILKNVFNLLGHEVEPWTTVVGQGGRRLFLSSRAHLTEAVWNPPTLQFRAAFPRDESGWITVSQVSRPSSVTIDGTPVAETKSRTPRSEAPASPKWKYDAELALVGIRPGSTGSYSVRVDGAEFRAATIIAPGVDRVAFEFEQGLDGWQAASQIDDLRAESGQLRGTAKGGDPYLHRLRVRLRGSDCRRIQVRAQASVGNTMALFWTTVASPSWGEDKVVRVPLQPGSDSKMVEYVFPVGDHAGWRDQVITALRLDPLEWDTGGTFAVDFIRGE